MCEACWTDDGSGSTIAVGPDAPGEPAGVRGAGPCFALSAGAVATLQVLLDKPLAELEGFDIDDRAAAEVEQVLAQTLAYHGH